MVVTQAPEEEVAEGSVTLVDIIISICNQLMRYLDNSSEERIHLLASLMMTMTFSAKEDLVEDFQEWAE